MIASTPEADDDPVAFYLVTTIEACSDSCRGIGLWCPYFEYFCIWLVLGFDWLHFG
jgi:hypothetical protein